MNLNRLTEQINEVVKWNLVSLNGKHDFSDDKKARQNDFTISEVKETLAAIAQDDIKEVFDGLGDVLVTYAYRVFLQYEEAPTLHELDEFNSIDTFNQCEWKWINVIQSLNTIAWAIDCNFHWHDSSESWYNLTELLATAEQVYTQMDIHDAIDEVLRSNWSKFVKLDVGTDINALESECRWIEANRGKSNVFYSIVELDDGSRYAVFRDDHGKGKIMKPSVFQEVVLPL
jgi:hypothetical protein